MQTVLITITESERNIDLEVPGDIPIHELLPEVVKLCGPQLSISPTDSLYWFLKGEDGVPLDPSRSLIDSGVLDGTMLILQDSLSWARERERERASQFIPGPLEPGPISGGIGIRWNKDELLKDH